MREVIHLSFGPQANYLNGRFYDVQQSYFVYRKEDVETSQVDPNVRFVYGKEFTPRALFWDYRNAFCSQRQYNHHYEEAQSLEEISTELGHAPLEVKRHSPSSSWTDKVRFPIHPKAMHTIPDWLFDSVEFPFGHPRGLPEDQKLEFDSVDEGEEQFKAIRSPGQGNAEDYLDDTFRPALEKCDLLDGVNVVTDLGGWAGFTIPCLEMLRDDYLQKTSVFTWTISRLFTSTRMKSDIQKSRLEALVAFSEHSDLVLPIQDTHSVDFNANAQVYMPSFETLCLMSSLRHNRVSMNSIVEDLTFDLPRANIVRLDNHVIPEFDCVSKNVRSTVTITRTSTKPESKAAPTSRADRTREYWCPQPMPGVDRFRVNISVNDSPLNLRKRVSSRDGELRDAIFDLTDDYIWGWDNESDEDD